MHLMNMHPKLDSKNSWNDSFLKDVELHRKGVRYAILAFAVN